MHDIILEESVKTSKFISSREAITTMVIKNTNGLKQKIKDIIQDSSEHVRFVYNIENNPTQERVYHLTNAEITNLLGLH